MHLHDYDCLSICPPKDQLLPIATGPPAVARPRHARPTQQPSVSLAKERAPKPYSARGGRRKEPSPVPDMAGDRKRWKSQHEHVFDCVFQQPLLQVLLLYCCTWVVEWVGRLGVGVSGCVARPAVAVFFGPPVLHPNIQKNTPALSVFAGCWAFYFM